MSTDYEGGPEWISQAEAARLQGVSRQAIHKLVRNGRLRSLRIGGHVLVARHDVEAFNPKPSGRPVIGDTREVDRIKSILDRCDAATRRDLFNHLKSLEPPHPVESLLNVNSEVILEALNRASELTMRMFRGVIAEAAFDLYIARHLEGTTSHPIEGNPPYDFRLSDEFGSVNIQVKLQRSLGGKPYVSSGDFVVETQRTRGGKRRAGEGSTRPYRFGEFDILAVCMQPSSGRWDKYRYTVARWLRPHPTDARSIATLQAVASEPNEDWTDDYLHCLEWFRSGIEKTVRGDLSVRNEDRPKA